MTHRHLVSGLCAAVALTAVSPAFAQAYDPAYRDRLDQYQDRSQDYQNRAQDYQDRTDTYRGRVEDYRDRRDAYEREQSDYDQQRAEYERARREYDARYGVGAYDRYRGSSDYRDSAVNDFAYRDACRERSNTRAVTGGVIGALAGAALGSNLAARNARPEGTVLGAVVGGALGAGIGKNSANCDDTGYYFTYAQTYPYRESSWERGRSGRYDYNYYSGRGCRLAIAPAEWGGRTDYRYVRVCPDRRGRYRITS